MPFEFKKLEIPGVVLVRPAFIKDERGFFAEIYKYPDFQALGIQNPFLQMNHSLSAKNVLRGLHYQKDPFAQSKFIRVLQGKIFDVAVDIRRGSPFFGKAITVTLDADKREMLFIPEGFAHGFLTLSDEAEVEYLCSNVYSPQNERGLFFGDPALGIKWPAKDPIVSAKDRTHPFLKDIDNNFVYGKE